MKLSFALLFILLFAGVSYGQITVDVYTKQMRVEVSDLEEVAPLRATSSCGDVTSNVTETIFSGGCLGTIERITVFKDDCGNEERASQYILMLDTEAPVFPNDEKSFNLTRVEADELRAPVVTDNSNKPVDMQMLEREEGQMIIQTFTATDRCGNKNSTVRRIRLKVPN